MQLIFELGLSKAIICLYLAPSLDHEQLEAETEPNSSVVPKCSTVT